MQIHIIVDQKNDLWQRIPLRLLQIAGFNFNFSIMVYDAAVVPCSKYWSSIGPLQTQTRAASLCLQRPEVGIFVCVRTCGVFPLSTLSIRVWLIMMSPRLSPVTICCNSPSPSLCLCKKSSIIHKRICMCFSIGCCGNHLAQTLR